MLEKGIPDLTEQKKVTEITISNYMYQIAQKLF